MRRKVVDYGIDFRKPDVPARRFARFPIRVLMVHHKCLSFRSWDAKDIYWCAFAL